MTWTDIFAGTLNEAQWGHIDDITTNHWRNLKIPSFHEIIRTNLMIIPHLDRSGWISIIILSKLSTIQPNVIIWVNYTIFRRNDEVIPEGFPLQNQLQAIWWGEVFWGRLKLQQNPRKQKTILYNYIYIYVDGVYIIYIFYICMNLHEWWSKLSHHSHTSEPHLENSRCQPPSGKS